MNYLTYPEFIHNYPKDYGYPLILVGKIKKSYLIGPIITTNFDKESFYKRIISSCIYNIKDYKKVNMRKIQELEKRYQDKLKKDEIIEITKQKEIIIHNFLPIPRGYYEKK